jgi:hypothetical protein
MKTFLLVISLLITMDAALAETVNCTRYKIEGKSLYKNMTELNLALPEMLEIPDR